MKLDRLYEDCSSTGDVAGGMGGGWVNTGGLFVNASKLPKRNTKKYFKKKKDALSEGLC